MAKDKLPHLLKEYEQSVRRNAGESEESIALMKEISRLYVERSDDRSAYRYTQKVRDAYEALYGPTYIWTEWTELYCRELRIRISPMADRVRLCRELWREVREDYGERSRALRNVAPLYLKCCCEAGDIAELKVLCSEVTTYFGENEDQESRDLVAMCRDYDILCGDKSCDIRQLEAACRSEEAAHGGGSLYALQLQDEIGRLYQRKKDFESAARIHGGILRTAQVGHGRYALETIVIQRDYVMDLTFGGHLRAALREAKKLLRAVEKCPDQNVCPDVYECFALIYSRMEKRRLAEKYGWKSLANRELKAGADSPDTSKSRYFLALNSLMSRKKDCREAFLVLVECLAEQEQRLHNLFLVSSEVSREKHFAMQNRGEYDVCFGAALSGLIGKFTDEDILALWEVACNYKTLMGDCEFLHSAVRKQEGMAEEMDSLKAAMQSADGRVVAEAERRLIRLSREADFPGYVNSVHVRDVREALGEDELLLDYYCVHFSDLEVYAVVAVTRHSLVVTELEAIGRVNGLVDQAALAIGREKRPGSSDEAGGETARNQTADSPESLLELLAKCLLPQMPLPPKVIICPDGELYRFAFDLLLGEAEIVYVTNPKDIARGRNSALRGSLPVRTVNVFADPSFHLEEGQATGSADEAAQERREGLSRLPGTLVEAEIIRDIYGDRVKCFTRREAGRQMFLRNCGADILHLGTHAGSENGGRIYLSGADDVGEGEEHPVFGSGYITPKDIASLNMEGTRLAVLSACRTGIGEYRDYLGVRGLRRAFQLAGVRTVMSTFWSVSDIATAVFMYVFYLRYSRCGSSTAAMRHAKNYLRTVSVREMREQIYPAMSEILARSGCREAYREFRDVILYGGDEERPFASPYYWAAFSIYDSFGS